MPGLIHYQPASQRFFQTMTRPLSPLIEPLKTDLFYIRLHPLDYILFGDGLTIFALTDSHVHPILSIILLSHSPQDGGPQIPKLVVVLVVYIDSIVVPVLENTGRAKTHVEGFPLLVGCC